jgi:hypothetical protein
MYYPVPSFSIVLLRVYTEKLSCGDALNRSGRFGATFCRHEESHFLEYNWNNNYLEALFLSLARLLFFNYERIIFLFYYLLCFLRAEEEKSYDPRVLNRGHKAQEQK